MFDYGYLPFDGLLCATRHWYTIYIDDGRIQAADI